jgi:hypothetical protein
MRAETAAEAEPVIANGQINSRCVDVINLERSGRVRRSVNNVASAMLQDRW